MTAFSRRMPARGVHALLRRILPLALTLAGTPSAYGALAGPADAAVLAHAPAGLVAAQAHSLPERARAGVVVDSAASRVRVARAPSRPRSAKIMRASLASGRQAAWNAAAATGVSLAGAPGLSSTVALVVDQDTDQPILQKGARAVMSIASITKLMTALVIVRAGLADDELVEITGDDIDTLKHTGSRLPIGTRLTRFELLHLALMASENRAANALGRSHPGGLDAFVAAMNATAQQLGMNDTVYADPTGLNRANRSSARDLVRLMQAAVDEPMIRELSTTEEATVRLASGPATFRNTNRLVRDASWEIGLQKTGFIREAGNCVVMQARIDGRSLWIVLLHANGSAARAADANRLRRWIVDGEGGAQLRRVVEDAQRGRTAA